MKYATPAERQLGLRIHAIVFVPSIIVLVVINLLTGAPYWVLWVLLGWGIGLLSHWLSVRGRKADRHDIP